MSETRTGKNPWPLRLACILPGIALILWALSDGPVIGGGPGIRLFDGAVLGMGVVTVLAGLLPARFAANYLAFFIAAMLALVVTELVLRNTVRGYYFSANEFDERVLFKLRPSTTNTYTHAPINGGETLIYSTNADGFSGPELLPQGEQTRVLVYGDSFMNAIYTPEEQRFTAKLQAELGERLGREVEVINAGIAGYGPDQVLRRMQTELTDYKPDLVIFGMFTGNDFGDLLRNRLYRLGEDNSLVENDYLLSDEQQRQIALNKHELVLIRVLKDLKDRLAGEAPNRGNGFDPEAWLQRALDQHLREYDEYIVQGDRTVGSFAVDPYSVDISTQPDSPSSQYKIRLMDKIFAAIVDEAKAANVPLMAMAIPHPMDLRNGDHSSGMIDPAVFPNYEATLLTDAATEIFARYGIFNVNLYQPFATEDVDALFLKGGDDHWNEAGQALAADIIADQIFAEGLLQ